jgi:hypothetical protein
VTCRIGNGPPRTGSPTARPNVSTGSCSAHTGAHTRREQACGERGPGKMAGAGVGSSVLSVAPPPPPPLTACRHPRDLSDVRRDRRPPPPPLGVLGSDVPPLDKRLHSDAHPGADILPNLERPPKGMVGRAAHSAHSICTLASFTHTRQTTTPLRLRHPSPPPHAQRLFATGTRTRGLPRRE